MKFDRVMIICASLQQRVAKMAYCLKNQQKNVVVLGENITVSKEFAQYLVDIPFVEIPVNNKTKRTPIGARRRRFIRESIINEEKQASNLLIIVRDVNYGAIVSNIVRKLKSNKIKLIIDVADNYDALYQTTDNFVKRLLYFVGFRYLTRTAFKFSDALIVVTPVNKERIEKQYANLIGEKPIYVLRNLPLRFDYWSRNDRDKKSFVYVGKIDEISRDPLYVIEKLRELTDYTLHFFSNEKKATIEKIKALSKQYGIENRVVFHEKVKYEDLSKAISQYSFGLVPHKRSPLTDFTVPNKLYDYKSAGVVAIMSDCPSLVNENETFGFGLIYSKEKDNFLDIVKQAESFKLDFDIKIPEWEEEFNRMIDNIEK